jgi:phosphoglycolate phosphatase-like HAD superfamily hydrolase
LGIHDLDHGLLDTRDSVARAVAAALAGYPGVAAPAVAGDDLRELYTPTAGWDGAICAERLLRAHLAGATYRDAALDAALAPAGAVDRGFLTAVFRGHYLGRAVLAALGEENLTPALEDAGTEALEHARVSPAALQGPIAVITHRGRAEALYVLGRHGFLGTFAVVVTADDAPTPAARVAEAARRLGAD